MEARYKLNKGLSVGAECTCPTCDTTFIKKSYQQAFCKTKCKDRYHNLVVPERRERAKHIELDRKLSELNSGGWTYQRDLDGEGWDGHKTLSHSK